MHELKGGCHCGNISLRYTTSIAPEDAEPRACQCSFCRKHQSRAVSDPAGRAEITIHDSDGVNRYRFGLASNDFLICRNCGVYVGGFMPDPDDAHGYATLMANALDDLANQSLAVGMCCDSCRSHSVTWRSGKRPTEAAYAGILARLIYWDGTSVDK